MRAAAWLAILIGLGVVALLVAWQGADRVAGHFGSADWAIFLVVLFALPELCLSGASWRCLFPREERPSVRNVLAAMWFGSSVNLLLPVATIGGEVVKARVLLQRGLRAALAVASVFVDKAVQAISILAWTLVGLAFLLLREPPGDLVFTVVLGAALLLLGIAGFIALQQARPFGFMIRRALALGRSERWQSLVDDASGLDESIRALYRRRGGLALASAIRLIARIVLAGEVWLAAWLMGIPVGFAEAVILKSLGMALRSAAFVVPGGIGLQEGAYVALGLIIGLPPDATLSLSLAGRLRELVFAVPGLFLWQLSEGRVMLARRPSTG